MVFPTRIVDTCLEFLQCGYVAGSRERGGCKSSKCSRIKLFVELWLRSMKFGVSSGLGLFPMTFDWAQIA